MCTGCHGIKGRALNPLYPALEGQSARYHYLQLERYQQKQRRDRSMETMVSILSREDMLNLAEYYAAQAPAAGKFEAEPERVDRGRAKSDEMKCGNCHGRALGGNDDVPRLAGQNIGYVVKQLKHFRDGARRHEAGAVANGLSDADIQDLGHYIAALR
jgi:cytochrome c553